MGNIIKTAINPLAPVKALTSKGNVLHNIDTNLDPIGIATQGKNDYAYNATHPTVVGPAGGGTSPTSNPASQLYTPPAGGNPQAAPPPGGYRPPPPGPTSTPGYVPNAFSSMNSMAGDQGWGTGPGALSAPAPNPGVAPRGPGGINAFRGGTPSAGAPPPTMNTQPIGGGNQQLQQQQMIAQMLRQGGPMRQIQR